MLWYVLFFKEEGVGGDDLNRLHRYSFASAEEHEVDLHRTFGEKCFNGGGSDSERLLPRVAVDAARDKGEGDGSERMLFCQGEAAPVTGGEQLGFAALAIGVDGAGGVDDVAGLEMKAGRDDRLPGLDGGKRGTGLGELGDAGCLEDGPAHPAAHPEADIGGVDDGVTLHGGDVAMDSVQGHTGSSPLSIP